MPFCTVDSHLSIHLQFCLHKIKSYDNLRCLQCLRRHQQELSTFSSIFISLSKKIQLNRKLSCQKKEYFTARLTVSVDPPLWLAFCEFFCVLLTDIMITRSYAALRAADLEWIIGPGSGSDGIPVPDPSRTFFQVPDPSRHEN